MTKLEQNAQPESNLNLNDVVDGKTLSEWVMSDHGLVDYSKLKFGHNVSNTKGRVIFDLGEYEFDPDVRETVYQNGVDLARVAACARYHTEYKGMRFKTAIDGWDHMMSFFSRVSQRNDLGLCYLFFPDPGRRYLHQRNLPPCLCVG